MDALDTYDGIGTERDEDAATSSRQRIVEDDLRYQNLKKIIGIKELKYIQSEWSRLRADEGANRALEIPAVKVWIESLKPKTREKARKWLGKSIAYVSMTLTSRSNSSNTPCSAFEFYRVHENLEALEKIDDANLATALAIFDELDGLEANLYGQIVQQRIQVIRTLQDKVDENAREKAIQQYLFDHLWLLHPYWERAESTEVMETRVTSLFEDIDATLTDDERQGRLDIGYRKTAGQHVVIELKRPQRVVTIPELIAQVGKYRSGMKRILTHLGTPYEPIEFVVLLGREPREWSDADRKDSAKVLWRSMMRGSSSMTNYWSTRRRYIKTI